MPKNSCSVHSTLCSDVLCGLFFLQESYLKIKQAQIQFATLALLSAPLYKINTNRYAVAEKERTKLHSNALPPMTPLFKELNSKGQEENPPPSPEHLLSIFFIPPEKCE